MRTGITVLLSDHSNNRHVLVGVLNQVTPTKVPLQLNKEFEAASRLVKKGKGTVLFRRGMASRGAYLVRRGQIELSLEDGADLYPTRLVGPGAMVGLPASVSGEPYSLTAVTTKDCELGFVPRKQLLGLLQSNTGIAMQLLQILSEEIAQMRQAAKAALSAARYTVH